MEPRTTEPNPLPVEPEFQGAGREALVRGLLNSYDRILSGSSGPLWVSLEAPSGWGKTRVAREFYKRLSAERQAAPHYWPPTILHGDPSTLLSVAARRKQLYPTFEYAHGSLPSFMWWGVAAGVTNGLGPLATDLRQFRTHDAYLADAWISRRSFAKGVVEEAKALLTGGAGAAESELKSLILEALGLGLPGLGIVQRLASNIVALGSRTLDRKGRLSYDGALGDDESDLVTAAFDILSGLATTTLPVVILVEDAHLADTSIAQLLGKLMLSSAAVLIITTAYPGELGDNAGIAGAMANAPKRIIRFTSDAVLRSSPDDFSDLFGENASLRRLPDADLEKIAPFYFPKGGVEPETLRRLVAKYPNPLALETYCSADKHRRLQTQLCLTSDQVDRLPNTIAKLHAKHWEELPEATRKALNLATFGIPGLIDPGIGQPTQWSVNLLLSALEEMDKDVREGVPAVLNNPAKSYSWIKSVTDDLRQFGDPDQMAIAATSDHFNSDERSEFAGFLASEVTSLRDSDIVFEQDNERFLSYLSLAIHKAGGEISAHALASSAFFLIVTVKSSSANSEFVSVKSSRADREQRIRIAEYALANFDHEYGSRLYSLGMDIKRQYARDLCNSGAAIRGAQVWELVVAALDSEFGPLEEIALAERYALARMYANDADAPQKALLFCMDVKLNILFADEGDTLGALGGWYARFTELMGYVEWCSGNLDEALKHYADALDAAIENLRANHPWTLEILDSYTSLLADMGRKDECYEWGKRRLEWGSSGMSPLSLEAFALRMDFAEVQMLAGSTQVAIDTYEAILYDQVSAWGKTNDEAIFTFDVLTAEYEAVGNVLPSELYLSMFDPERQREWHREDRERKMSFLLDGGARLVSDRMWDQAIGWYEQTLAYQLETRISSDPLVQETRLILEGIRTNYPEASGVGFDGRSMDRGLNAVELARQLDVTRLSRRNRLIPE
ncbi:tetratricopeptide repeat protein [Cryobacterium sp. AP23]